LEEVPQSFSIQNAPPDRVRIINQELVYTFYLHSGVYTFFSSLESTLDRVRLELNSIYFDGGKNPSSKKGNWNWAGYTDPNNDRILKMNNAGFAVPGVLTGTLSASLHQTTSKYRNRLIHDGDLPVQVDESNVTVYLPDDPSTTLATFTFLIVLEGISLIVNDQEVSLNDQRKLPNRITPNPLRQSCLVRKGLYRQKLGKY